LFHHLGVEMLAPAQGIGPQGLHPLGHFMNRGHPLGGIGRRNLKHLQAVRLQADLVQQLFGVLYPLSGSEISFQEMAAAGLSPTHEDGVGPGFEPFEDMDNVDAAGAQILDDAHGGRILHPGRARHIRGGVSAVGAHQGQDFGGEVHLRLLICQAASIILSNGAQDAPYFLQSVPIMVFRGKRQADR
jgi:hypothetical protein